MMKVLRLIAAATVLALTVGTMGRARADEIDVIATGIGTGSLGGSRFVDAAFTITAISDTTRVVPIGSGGLDVGADNSVVTISVGSVSATVMDPTIIFNLRGSSAAGIASGTTSSPGVAVEAVHNTAFASYDLLSSIGPLTGTAFTGNPPPLLNTTLGAFTLGSVVADSGTIQVVVESSTIPEPASLTSATLVALAGLGGYFWHRRRPGKSAPTPRTSANGLP
jgi:MYXO-CTERM domain-containing protein